MICDSFATFRQMCRVIIRRHIYRPSGKGLRQSATFRQLRQMSVEVWKPLISSHFSRFSTDVYNIKYNVLGVFFKYSAIISYGLSSVFTKISLIL